MSNNLYTYIYKKLELLTVDPFINDGNTLLEQELFLLSEIVGDFKIPSPEISEELRSLLIDASLWERGSMTDLSKDKIIALFTEIKNTDI